MGCFRGTPRKPDSIVNSSLKDLKRSSGGISLVDKVTNDEVIHRLKKQAVVKTIKRSKLQYLGRRIRG